MLNIPYVVYEFEKNGGIDLSKEAEITMTLPPPLIPLKILNQPAPQPVPKPSGAGFSQSQTAAAAEPSLRKKKERRMELQGLEGGDPRSTYHLLRRGFRNVLKNLPLLLRKYGYFVPVVLMGWTILGTLNTYRMPAFIGNIVMLLVFLTAAYNSFIGKAVFGTLVIRVIIPMGRRIRREGFGKVSGEFKTLIPNFRTNWSAVGARSLGLLVLFAGSAAFISNFLTRNNAIDKIAVSLVIAVSLIKALSDGPRSIPFMTSRVVMKDIFVLLGKPSPVRNHHIYVAISGLVLGFLCSLPLSVLRKSMGENIGYILGMLAMVAGIALLFTLKEKKPNV